MSSSTLLTELIRSALFKVPGLKNYHNSPKRVGIALRDERVRKTWFEPFDRIPGLMLAAGAGTAYNPDATGTLATFASGIKTNINLNRNWVVNGDNSPGSIVQTSQDGAIRMTCGTSANAKMFMMPLYASVTATPDFVTTGGNSSTGATGTNGQSQLINSPIALTNWCYERNPYFRVGIRVPSTTTGLVLVGGFRSVNTTTVQSAMLGSSSTPLATALDPAIVSGLGDDHCLFQLETGAASGGTGTASTPNLFRGALVATPGWRVRQGQGAVLANEIVTAIPNVGYAASGGTTLQAGKVIDIELSFEGGTASRIPVLRIDGVEVFRGTTAMRAAASALASSRKLVPFIGFGNGDGESSAKSLDVCYIECGIARSNPEDFASAATSIGTATNAGLLTD